jgi:hypothetical protein
MLFHGAVADRRTIMSKMMLSYGALLCLKGDTAIDAVAIAIETRNDL